MAYQNFTTVNWVEVDSLGVLGVAATTITSTLMQREGETYVYRDFGVGGITGNFEHLIQTQIISGNNNDSRGGIWGAADVVDDISGWVGTPPFLAISWWSRTAAPTITIGDGVTSDESIGLSYTTPYYLKITSSGLTVTAYIYSDASRTSLVDTISVTRAAPASYRYLYATWNHDVNQAARTITFTVSNLDLQITATYDERIELVIPAAVLDDDLTDWQSLACVCDMDLSINADNQAFVAALQADLSDFELADAAESPRPWRRVLYSQTADHEKLWVAFNAASLSDSADNSFYLYRGYSVPIGESDGSNVVSAATVGYWPFEGDFADWTANSYDGTNSGAGATTASNGRGALEFLTTDFVSVPDAVGNAIASLGTVAVVWDHNGVTSAGHFFDSRSSSAQGWDFGITLVEGTANNLAGLIDVTAGSLGYVVSQVNIGLLSSAIHTAALRYNSAGSAQKTFASTSSDAQSNTGTATRTASPVKFGNQLNNGDPLGSGRYLVEAIVLSAA